MAAYSTPCPAPRRSPGLEAAVSSHRTDAGSRGIGRAPRSAGYRTGRARLRRRCAALWAKRRLGEKNRLTASDARRVEEAFQAKLAGFGGPADEAGAPDQPLRPTSSFHRPQRHRNDPARRAARAVPGATTSYAAGGKATAKAEDIGLSIPDHRDRQGRLGLAGAPPGSGPRTRQTGGQAPLPGLRPPALRSPPFAVHAEGGHSVARSAMSSPSRSVAGTIARSTVAATKPHGGGKSGSIRPSPPGRCGCRRIRCRQLRTKRASKVRPRWPLSVPVSETPSVIGR